MSGGGPGRMGQATRLILNTLSNVGALVVNSVVGILLAPFLLNELGQSAYGIWTLTGSLLAYSSLLSLGLNSAVNRWLPMYLVERNQEGIDQVVSTTIVTYAIGAVLLLVATAVLTVGFPTWFSVPPELVDASRITVGLVGLGFVALVVLNVFGAVLSGLQRYDVIAAVDVVADVARVACVVGAVLGGFGLAAVALVTALVTAIRASFKARLAIQAMPELRIRLSNASWQKFREMFGYSVNSLLYSSGQIIQRQAALLVVGLLLTAGAAAEYAVPLLVVSTVGQLVLRGSAAMKPAATHLDATRRSEDVIRLYLSGTKYALLLVLPITAFLAVYGEELLRLWLRQGYMPESPAILTALAIGAVFRLWHMPAFYVVVGLGRHRGFGILTVATGLLSIVLAVVGVATFDLGSLGVAVGFAVSESLIGAFLVTPYCCRALGIPVWREVRESVLPAVVATMPFAVALLAARARFSPASLLALLVLVVALGATVLPGWWFWGFSASEKARFARVLPRPKKAS